MLPFASLHYPEPYSTYYIAAVFDTPAGCAASCCRSRALLQKNASLFRSSCKVAYLARVTPGSLILILVLSQARRRPRARYGPCQNEGMS